MRFGNTGAEIAQEINSKADALLAQAVDLMQMGYASELVMAKIDQSIFSNQPIKYDSSVKRISSSDDPKGQINEDIIFSQGQNLVDTSILIQDITKAINYGCLQSSKQVISRAKMAYILHCTLWELGRW